MASAARAVDRGRIDSRFRVNDSADLSRVVDALRPNRGSEPVESARIGMADGFAPTD